MSITLGIGIITYNRLPLLFETLEKIRRYTSQPFELVVADDGSTDGTSAELAKQNIPFVTGTNRGIAWNRNRALWWLKEVKKCQQIIIFEDDCCPMEYAWEQPWIDAINRFGHVNYLPQITLEVDNDVSWGAGTPELPFIAPMHQALCVGYHADALNFVGYLDSRFRRYGEEHVEHTHRFLRAGYGGLPQHRTPERGQVFYLKSNFKALPSKTTCDEDALKYNISLHQSIQNEPVYRAPWRNDVEMFLFREEIEAALPRPKSSQSETNWEFDYLVSLSNGLTPTLAEIFGSEKIASSFFEGFIAPFHVLTWLFQTGFRKLFHSSCLYAYHGRLRCRDSLIIYDTCLDDYPSDKEGLVEHLHAIRPKLAKKYMDALEVLDQLCSGDKKILFVRDWHDSFLFEGVHRPAHSLKPDFNQLYKAIAERYPNLDFRILFTNFGNAYEPNPALKFANLPVIISNEKQDFEKLFQSCHLGPVLGK